MINFRTLLLHNKTTKLLKKNSPGHIAWIYGLTIKTHPICFSHKPIELYPLEYFPLAQIDRIICLPIYNFHIIGLLFLKVYNFLDLAAAQNENFNFIDRIEKIANLNVCFRRPL